MARQYDFRAERFHAPDCRLEVVDLEPQQKSISRRHIIWITDPAMMIFSFPVMQLKNQLVANHQSLIVRPAVCALRIKNLLIPAAARFHISRTNQRLWTHFFTAKQPISQNQEWPKNRCRNPFAILLGSNSQHSTCSLKTSANVCRPCCSTNVAAVPHVLRKCHDF
jgi:hypothetical protein